MNKIIQTPGNGINFPQKGKYCLVDLNARDGNNKQILDSKQTGDLCIRFKSEEFLFNELETLLGEMSLYERCILEISKSYKFQQAPSQCLLDCLRQTGKITFELELKHISDHPMHSHYNK